MPGSRSSAFGESCSLTELLSLVFIYPRNKRRNLGSELYGSVLSHRSRTSDSSALCQVLAGSVPKSAVGILHHVFTYIAIVLFQLELCNKLKGTSTLCCSSCLRCGSSFSSSARFCHAQLWRVSPQTKRKGGKSEQASKSDTPQKCGSVLVHIHPTRLL